MKKQLYLFAIATMLATPMLKAQDEEFHQVWESEFENKAKTLSVVDGSANYILGTDNDEATLLDASGAKIWYHKYKELTEKEGVRDADIQNIYWGANLLFLFDKRMGKDKLSVVDVKAGKMLWTTNEYSDLTEDNIEYIADLDAFFFSLKNSTVLINARTGAKIWETDKFKGSIGGFTYLATTKELLMVNYKPTTLAALFSGFKNQLVRINAINGEIKWATTFTGFVEKEVLTRRPLVKIFLNGDKVFLQLDGLQAFDYSTGQSLWKAVYETDEAARAGIFNRGPHGGRVVKGGIYHAIADPLIDGNSVYIVLGSGKIKNKFVAAFDLETGKQKWESDKITSAIAMPSLHLSNGKLVCQIGGIVNQQTIEKKVESGAGGSTTTTYYNNEWIFLGGYGIITLDAATGKKAWKSEKFDKRITNLVFTDKMVYAGSGDEFYGFDIQSGEMKIDVDHSKGKVGKSMWAFENGENIVLVCDKGVAAYSKKNGTQVYTSDKFKGVTSYHIVGNNFFLRKDNGSSNTIACVDLTNGNIIGSVKSKGKGGGGEYGDGIDITTDGEYIFAFKGKKVQKLKVH